MTNKENETIERLYKLMDNIRDENQKFREDINQKVNTYTEKVDKKAEPIYFEQDIVQTAKNSIKKAMIENLTSYGNPLSKLINSVVQSHYNELKDIIDDCFIQAIKTEDFKQTMTDEFSHKVARTLISKNDGMLEKVCNNLKQNATFRSKVTLAIDNVVSEFIKENK